MMDINQQMEQISFAYVRAVASAAGFGVSEPPVDDDSIDLQIASRSAAGTVRSPRLELQVKCIRGEPLRDDEFSYPLKIKNYDDLRAPNVLVPRALVVVRVPETVDQWVECSDEQLILRHCGYWKSLHCLPDSDNTASVSVTLRRDHLFNVEGLTELMSRIGRGGRP